MRVKAIRFVAVVALCAAVAPWAAAQTAAAKPLATVDTNWEGVTIDLMAVERKGSILTVKWAVKNTGAKQAHLQFGLTGKNPTTYVVDEDSGTKYYTLTDKEKNTLASEHAYLGSDTHGIEDYIEAGASLRYWMKLPAPPPAVKAITIFFSQAEPLESVAITDK
jgi:hypothetical protein